MQVLFKVNVVMFFIRLVDDRCFIVDSRNILWRYKCCGRGYGARFIMRNYDSLGTIVDLNVHDKDIYVLARNGNILKVKEWGLHFSGIAQLNRPDFYKSPVIVMFLKHSVVYSGMRL